MRLVALSLASCLLLGWAHAAHAQKPVITESADEPGRNPYQETVYPEVPSNLCGSTSCIAYFRVVPPGKRLVLTFASASFSVVSAAAPPLVILTNPNFDVQAIVPGLAQLGTSFQFQTTGPVTFYVETGSRPVIVFNGGAGGRITATVAGYYVTTP